MAKATPNHPTRAEYIAMLREQWRAGAAWIIETGKVLCDAKDKLPHGEWVKMYVPDGMNTVTKRFEDTSLAPFNLRVAQQFMAIAKHPVLSNASNCSYLPRSYRTLYILSRLHPTKLQMAIDAGRVHSEMTGKDANVLLIDAKLPRMSAAVELLVEMHADYSASLVDDPTDRLADAVFSQLEPEQRVWIGQLAEVAQWLTKISGPLHEKWTAERDAQVKDENDVG